MLIYPMIVMAFYIFAIGIVTLIVRVKAANERKLHVGYFKHLDANHYKPPEFIVTMGRHFDNQFQMPILFLITVLTAIVLKNESQFFVILAWTFILSRICHTIVHLGSNHILKRAYAYFAGVAVLILMWSLIAAQALSATS